MFNNRSAIMNLQSFSCSPDDIYELFSSSIRYLGLGNDNVNNDVHINMLTTMTKDVGLENAPKIIRRIETHLQLVNSELLIPGILLIDSIIKNLGFEYVKLFNNNIVTIFCFVCDKVEIKSRQTLYWIRQSWINIFPNHILNEIDRRVNIFDKQWPMFTPEEPPFKRFKHDVCDVDTKTVSPDWNLNDKRIRKIKKASRKWYVRAAMPAGKKWREGEVVTIRGAENESDNICENCGCQFEPIWNNNDEEWHIKNAIQRDDKLYHVSCFENLYCSQ